MADPIAVLNAINNEIAQNMQVIVNAVNQVQQRLFEWDCLFDPPSKSTKPMS